MYVEIIAIGDEILSGNITNTNAGFLSFELKKLGYETLKHTVLSDDETLLKEGIKNALKREGLVITTGGLGPTYDDRTKKTIAEFFNMPLEYDSSVGEDLKRRFRRNRFIESLAYVPKGTIVLKNEIGTAPGFIFESEKNSLILLPGVPYEMKKMFSSYVISYLKKKYIPEKIYQEEIYIFLLSENEVEPFLEELRFLEKEVKIGIYPYFAHLKVSLTSKSKEGLKKINFLKEKLKKKFKEHFCDFEIESIEGALKKELIDRKRKVVFAESCSGGALAASMTALSEASLYFLGSFVCYSNELKKDILGVSESTLERKGAVSKETVEEMVLGVFERTKADYAVAVSGIAGPGGGSEEKPIGTVFVAIGERKGKIDSGCIHVSGDRGFVIKYVVNFVNTLFLLRLKKNFFYFKDS
jgi:nicotinamide-nucleotide amidase